MENSIGIKKTENINFGQLYLKKGFLKNNTYKYNDDILNLAKITLEDMAKDVDIVIKYRNLRTKGFDITVSDKIKSPIKRFFYKNFSCNLLKEKIRPEDLYNSSEGPTDLLVRKVKETKEEFKNFYDYIHVTKN